MTTDARTIYQGSLRNTHALEQQGLQQMERQVDGLSDYPDYAAVLRGHIDTTRAQLRRIEGALNEAGGSASGAQEAFTGAVGSAGAAVHGLFQDTTLKNLYAGYAFQFDQIAAYRSLAVIAAAAGFAGHAGWIETSIAEEKTAADAVEALIEPVTRRYLELTQREHA